MLPSRLFRNLGIPPYLRSLIIPHPALSPSILVQLRLRLRILPRHSSTSAARPSQNALSTETLPPAPHASQTEHSTSLSAPSSSQQLPAEEARMSLTFTCTVPNCSERSSHQFTKRAYERGIVLVTCPKCKNRHLIADHLGWFKDTEGTNGGKLRTIEDLMRAKGEKVSRGRLDTGGVVEFLG